MTQAEMELARRLVLLLAKDEEMELLLVALEKAEKALTKSTN
jgi:hypothetical protein